MTKLSPKDSLSLRQEDRVEEARQALAKPGKQQKAKMRLLHQRPGKKMDNFFKSATPSTVVAAPEAVREASNDGPPAALLPDPEPTEMLVWQ